MSSDRYYFGDVISHTLGGDVVNRMAVVLQRREGMELRRRYVFVIIGCPYCGEHHEHGDGSGFRVPHCRSPSRFQKDYFIMDTSLPIVPCTTPYPGEKYPPHRSWG